MTDLAAFEQYLLVLCGLARTTATAYVRDVSSWVESDLPIERWAIQDTTKGVAPDSSTVVRRLAAVKRYCKFLREPDVTADIPRPKAPHRLPRPVADVQEKIRGLKSVDAKMCAILLYETGMRISEAYSLRLDAKALPDDVTITGKGGKDRIIPLSDLAKTALLHLNGRLPYTRGWLQRKFRVAGFSPHQLRHTYATELAESGADLGEVQDLLGHASPQTTRGYMHYSKARLRKALDRRVALRDGTQVAEDTPMPMARPRTPKPLPDVAAALASIDRRRDMLVIGRGDRE